MLAVMQRPQRQSKSHANEDRKDDELRLREVNKSIRLKHSSNFILAAIV